MGVCRAFFCRSLNGCNADKAVIPSSDTRFRYSFSDIVSLSKICQNFANCARSSGIANSLILHDLKIMLISEQLTLLAR